ncbi:MAG TPA: carbohydrate-binding protein [Ruminococcus sp.]|nr:carbohydrate-binding protein [Ruminococcus sp.]
MRKREQICWKRLKRTAAAVCAILCAAAPAGEYAALPVYAAAETPFASFYVSPDGDDANPGTLEAPLRTLAGARDAVRQCSDNMNGDIVVNLRGGIYRQTEPVVFDVGDSGKNGFKVIYQAYEDEEPVISGAAQITGWQKYNDTLYAAPLSRDVKLRNLYVNDHRANMGSKTVQAKGGYGEYRITAGQADWAWDSGIKSDGIKYSANDLPRITENADCLEVVNGTTWNENIVCARDVKYDGGNFVLLMQQPYGSIAQTPGWGAGFSTGGTHTLYNAFAFVDSPGEFFFDKAAQMLYYYPYASENMDTADVEAPIAEQLVVLHGESTANRIHDIAFSGITFAHTEYQLTDVAGSHGKTTCQAAQTYTAFADSNWHSKKYEMVDTLPAMIHITNAESVSLTGNTVKHSGSDGISMTNDVIDSTVSGNYITDITSSGITVGHPQHIYIGDGNGSNRERFPAGIEGICKNDVISDNLLYDISVVHGFGGCAAITVYYADTVSVLRNQIEKTAYNGIHLGWGWCNFKDSETCRNNKICYNRVIRSLNRLHDSGGIYTIGQMPGTVINENYVQGIPAAAPYQPTYGLHNDEGTAYIEENDNVLEISPDVTYTINCEDYGQKHHLTILRTYATVRKMGVNPPDSRIDDPIVVSDNVWPQAQYEICLHSGLQDAFKSILPDSLMTDADYVFPASCATACETSLPIRSAGAGKTVWIAPANTTVFKTSASVTKANGKATKIKTPSEEGEYRIFVTDRSGNVLSSSAHLLRVSGTAAGVPASSYSVQSGIQTENCSEGGNDVAYIENGDYIGFENVDFGTDAYAVDFRIGANAGGSALEIRLDAPDGKLIGTLDVASTGGWQTWNTQRAEIQKTSGVHDLYFVFKGGEGYLFNVAWWKLLNPQSGFSVPYLPGDVNADGQIDARDLSVLKSCILNDEEPDIPESADLNADGILDEEDAALHLQYLLGRIDSFPAS